MQQLIALNPTGSSSKTIELNIQEAAQAQDLPGASADYLPEKGMGTLISGLLQVALVVAVLLVFAQYIWGAIEWITSGSEKNKADQARSRITQATIGLIVLVATTALIMLVQNVLGLSVINFTFPKDGGSKSETIPGGKLQTPSKNSDTTKTDSEPANAATGQKSGVKK